MYRKDSIAMTLPLSRHQYFKRVSSLTDSYIAHRAYHFRGPILSLRSYCHLRQSIILILWLTELMTGSRPSEHGFTQVELSLCRISWLQKTRFFSFSEFTIDNIRDAFRKNDCSWMEKRMQEGKPFVIRGFNSANTWNRRVLSNASLLDLSSSEGTSQPFMTLRRSVTSLCYFPS